MYVVLQLLVWLALLIHHEKDTVQISTPGICFRCGYDLRGLGPNPVCPECGRPETPVMATRTRFALRPAVVTCFLPVFGVTLAYFAAYPYLTLFMDTGINLWLGYPLETAMRAAQVRGESPGFPVSGVFLVTAPLWCVRTVEAGKRWFRWLLIGLAAALMVDVILYDTSAFM